MIFVTLGTQDKEFNRLLEAIDKEIEKGNIKDKVIVQAGCSMYRSSNMEIYSMLSMEEFEKYVKSCDILITHAGVGSIMTGLFDNKKVIAVPRLKKYHEHHNDHQLEIARNFDKLGYIKNGEDLENIGKIILEMKDFKPKKYKSNNAKFRKTIEDFIDNN